MVEFLKNYGIKDNVIKEIENVNTDANLFNLKCNELEVVKIINYLNSIGITCLDELLVYRLNIFFMDLNTLKSLLEKYDLDKFVSLVNNDYTLIDRL